MLFYSQLKITGISNPNFLSNRKCSRQLQFCIVTGFAVSFNQIRIEWKNKFLARESTNQTEGATNFPEIVSLESRKELTVAFVEKQVKDTSSQISLEFTCVQKKANSFIL